MELITGQYKIHGVLSGDKADMVRSEEDRTLATSHTRSYILPTFQTPRSTPTDSSSFLSMIRIQQVLDAWTVQQLESISQRDTAVELTKLSSTSKAAAGALVVMQMGLLMIVFTVLKQALAQHFPSSGLM